MFTVPVLGPAGMWTLSPLKVQYRTVTSCVVMKNDSLAMFGPPMITSPGAVWHAMVINGLVIRYMEAGVMIPATRKMHVRGPLALVQSRREPAPESFRLVTSNT